MNRVINATVLSNFAAVAKLEVLRHTTSPLYLPFDVYNELLAGRLAGYSFYDRIEDHIHPFTPHGWLNLTSMTDNELRLAATLPGSLHVGERACLSIAHVRGWGLLTDDRTTRVQAKAWRIPLSGTIGVLLLAVEDGLLSVDHANKVLAEMIVRAKYRSPVDDLSDLFQ